MKAGKIHLGDVIDINPEAIGSDFPFSEIQYIEISAVGSGSLDVIKLIPLENAPSRAKRLANHGDTILSTVRPNRRTFLFVKNPPKNLVVSTGFAVLRSTDAIDPRYLYCLIRQQEFTDYLTNNAKGAAYPAVDKDIISRAEISLPSLSTQCKIAAILTAYDDLIENNTRRIALLEEMAQIIYHEWFVHFHIPGQENVKMVNSELGPIPERWEVSKIDDVIQVIGGGTPSTKVSEYWNGGDINWFAPKDLTSAGTMFVEGSPRKISQIGLHKSSAKMFPAYSVMMTSRATLGVTAINTTPACTNQGFITCIPNDRISAHQIYFWIADNVEIIKSIASGATFKEITKTTFRTFPILIADPSSNRRFIEQISPIGNLILTLQRMNANLQTTRDLLLPKLLSGQLDVGDLEINFSDTSRYREF